MNRIATNYILNLLYDIVAIAVPLLTAPYLTRILHPENYGVYSYVQSLAGVIITLSLLGIYSYGNRQIAYVRDNQQMLSNAFWEIMCLRIILGLVGTICYFSITSHNRYNNYFALYYAYYLSNIIDCSWVYVGTENMFPCVSKNIIAKLLTLVGVFLLVKNESHVGRYIALVAISMLITNICVYVQLSGVVLRPRIHWRNLIDHLKGSAFLFLPQIASILYLQMGKVMMGSMTGRTDQVSFYDQAEKLVTVALSCITVLSTVMMPRIANEFKKNNIESVTYYLNKGAKYSMAIAAPMMVGLWCTAIYLIPWYLGKDYMPTAYAIMIIAPIVVFNSLMGISGRQYFVATNKIIPLTLANIIAAVSNILLNVILIPKWGYKGSAVATVVSSALNVFFQFYWMNMTISVRYIMKGTCRYLIYAVVMGGVTVMATFSMKLYASVWTTVIQMMVAMFVYGFMLCLAKDEIYFTGRKIVCDCLNKFVLRKHKSC